MGQGIGNGKGKVRQKIRRGGQGRRGRLDLLRREVLAAVGIGAAIAAELVEELERGPPAGRADRLGLCQAYPNLYCPVPLMRFASSCDPRSPGLGL
jgi:hypothetical protein